MSGVGEVKAVKAFKAEISPRNTVSATWQRPDDATMLTYFYRAYITEADNPSAVSWCVVRVFILKLAVSHRL